MPVSSATQAVGAGIATAAVAATLPTSYQISLSPSWVTAWDVVAKTAAGFTVNFGTPAPVGGGTFDWVALGPAGAPLAGTSGATVASGSQAVGAGLASVAVVSSLVGSGYQVSVSPNWVTDSE